jgi:hypothetical protein
MVALRVSRRTALVAAAGWVAAPGWPDVDDWWCGSPTAIAPPGNPSALCHGEGLFVLYHDLARFLRDEDTDRPRALRRALGRRHAAARAAYGDGFDAYLLRELGGLGPPDAVWAARADAADVPGQVRNGLARARFLLHEEEAPPVFLMFSHRFDGRADGSRIFLGVDRFGAERLRDQVALLTVHEFNHIVRARSASFGSLLDGIIAEGLATACSELSEPGRPLHDYLVYTPDQMRWFSEERLQLLWADLASDPYSTDVTRRRAYLDGGRPGPCGAPPRSGYYLGYLLARRRMEHGASIADLTRLPAEAFWPGAARAGS